MKNSEGHELSTIPLLDGTNYSHWHLRIKIHLRSKDLIEVCEKPLPLDASIPATNKWYKSSYEAINIITSNINERVFREVVNNETTDKANLLWAKLNEQYASRRALNRGRVWMDWQRTFYDGNLQSYIDTCRKMIMELDSVDIKVPNEILSFSLLGKLGGESQLHQFIEVLTLNEELIEKPNIILSRLQDFANLQLSKRLDHDKNPSALFSASNEPFKKVYYCSNGRHNQLCTTHRKEDCWAENPHLRPARKEKRRKIYNASTHLSVATDLITSPKASDNTLNDLVVDCGATHHMFNNESFFRNLEKSVNIPISTGDINSTLIASGIGTVDLMCNNKTLSLENCLYVPKLKCNLVSLLELFKKQLTIHRQNNKFILKTINETILVGNIINRLMYIDYSLPKTLLTVNNDLLTIWHNRLGHPGSSILKAMGLPPSNNDCLVCQKNKCHQLPYAGKFEEANLPLDCLHLDLVGPISPSSLSGCSYFLTIVDQATGFKMIKFLKRKSEAFQNFLSAKRLMENKHERKLKKLVSDRGSEFLNNQFKELSEECGFIHFFSPPETPQHNGYAERANRTILEKARCLLNPTNLPKSFWAEAVNTAVFLLNLSPTLPRNKKSPYLLWNNLPARINRLKTFGCRAKLFNHHRHRDWKLAPPGSEGIFLGYENDNTSYQILRLTDSKIIITCNAIFNEKILPKLISGDYNTRDNNNWG
ncbi:hypothetical protein O181_018619 [Austropuccinia psidii MF-1]|uniref:Integrase catalytic domain-containing protein n=1 Tax=Austropuccinia psidii MF-1 TaxID=1389203 RepID=A0A9Q3C5L2_9BASI|nr:hypothetical protein [Austropuccinia psidii MF-1]